jgi:hypothetical protein
MTVKDTTEPGVPILAGPTPVPVPASDPENPVLASSTPASVDNASTLSAPVPASVPPLMQPAVVKSVAASAPPPSAAAKVVHPGAGAGAGGAVHRAPKFGRYAFLFYTFDLGLMQLCIYLETLALKF